MIMAMNGYPGAMPTLYQYTCPAWLVVPTARKCFRTAQPG